MTQSVKNAHAVQKTVQVQSLGQEDPLEKEMVTHFSILAYEISWMGKPDGLSLWDCKIWTCGLAMTQLPTTTTMVAKDQIRSKILK